MTKFDRVRDAYRYALRQSGVIVPVHIGAQLVAFALVAPVFSAVFAFAIGLSDQSALTDQDIARFLLTPVGAIAGLTVGALFLLAAVFSFAVMTVHLARDGAKGISALPADLGYLAARWRPLLGFAVQFILRVGVIVAPVALICLWLAARNLTEFDINYYLTETPPEFTRTVFICGVLLAGAAIVLINRLLAWAVSLHFVLFEGTRPRDAFAASSEHISADRFALLRALIVWFVIRFAVVAVVAVVAGILLNQVPPLFSPSLTAAVTAALAILALWGLVRLFVAAIALGALAKILLSAYGGAEAAWHGTSELRLPNIVLAGGVIALVLVGVFGASVVLDDVQTEDDVTIIAHRGGAIARPENTMAAIVKGVEDGADMIEIDVQETADGEVVVVHDSDFMKVAGNPIKIWDATMDDLAEIDIGSWFDPIYADQRTVTLADTLEAVRDKAILLIELKYYGHDVDLENRVINIVVDAGMADQVAIMSLKYPAVQKMLSLRPDWPTGVLAATAIGDLTGLEGDFLAVSTASANASLARRAADAGKELYVWTVNDALSMSAAISMGADGLITDDPALVHEVLAQRAEMSTPERLALLMAQRFGLTLSGEASNVIEQ
ncbi:MAG: glycerophosphoryl diester phosphodiesterase membrane domain-containing protein [Rhodobacteraceae bacterium]|nr:glycerophosphoryl diester phosphodiesterase membrane domain-containing protein [Paracoccaceae bacterium]